MTDFVLRSVIWVTVVSPLLYGSYSQLISFGHCPQDLAVVTDFNLTEYLGVWYEQYRYFVIFQMGASCVIANYTKTEDGALGVLNSAYSRWDEKGISINGIGKLDSVKNEAKLIIEFPNYGVKPAIYWVLGTDYTSYAVVWSCENIGAFHLKFVWILTREQQPNNEAIDKAMQVLKTANISRKPLLKTDQTNCKASVATEDNANEINRDPLT